MNAWGRHMTKWLVQIREKQIPNIEYNSFLYPQLNYALTFFGETYLCICSIVKFY